MLERLREQLLVVRELTVDAPRRQPDVGGCEHDLVVVHAELDRVSALRDARQLGEGAGRNDRLQIGNLSGELRLLHREPV